MFGYQHHFWVDNPFNFKWPWLCFLRGLPGWMCFKASILLELCFCLSHFWSVTRDGDLTICIDLHTALTCSGFLFRMTRIQESVKNKNKCFLMKTLMKVKNVVLASTKMTNSKYVTCLHLKCLKNHFSCNINYNMFTQNKYSWLC